MKLIDKSAVIAEIKRMRDKAYPQSEWNHGYVTSCEKILSFLDTIEVKEVDSDKEIGMYTTKELLWKRNKATNVFHLTQGDIDRIAKYFFELGIKSKGE